MNLTGRVAVLIVNFNSGAYLGRCLTSLGGQSRPADRILIVDNASRDNSLENLPHPTVPMEIVRWEHNKGFAAANNFAIQKVDDCEWVALLNPDTEPEPDWLKRLLAAAGTHPDYTFFSSHLVSHADPTVLDGTGDIYHVSGLAWRRDHGRKAGRVQRETGEVFSACAAAALYQRDAVLEAGGFDESFFTYFEDVDLGFRLRLLGHRCLYVADARIRHAGWGSSGRTSDFSIYHGHRNLIWSFFKNMPDPLLWRYLPFHILQNFIFLVWFSLKGKPIIFKSKWDALRGLPVAWGQRKSIQATMKITPQELKQYMEKDWWALFNRKF